MPPRTSAPVAPVPIRIELGNVAPLEAPPDIRPGRDYDGPLVRADRPYPCVTYVEMPGGLVGDDPMDERGMRPVLSFDESSLPHHDHVKMHMAQVLAKVGPRRGVTQLPGHEAIVNFVHPTEGIWQRHSEAEPLWVWSDNKAMERFLADYFGCAAGRPDFVEESHYTRSGPPGIDPTLRAIQDIQGNITQNGRDGVARNMGGSQAGTNGTATATTSTSLTTGAITSVSSNQYAGCRITAGTAWGIIVSHTSGTTPVFTVDRWYSFATPGGSAASTPSSTTPWSISDGGAPYWFVGLSADTTSPGSPDTRTSLTSEITTSGGGLVRKIATWAHTASTNTYTLTVTFTANGSDSLPVTVASDAVFNSMVASDTTSTMLFVELLGTTATLSASGDQLSLTITVTTT